MRYYIEKDKQNNRLAWFACFVEGEVEVTRNQYYFLRLCGFLGYRDKNAKT